MKKLILLMLMWSICGVSFGQNKQYGTYVVAPTDDLFTILQKFDMQKSDLVKLNPGLLLDAIIPGIKIKVSNPKLAHKQPQDVKSAVPMSPANVVKYETTPSSPAVQKPILYNESTMNSGLLTNYIMVEKDGKIYKIDNRNLLSASIGTKTFIPTTVQKRKEELDYLAQRDFNVTVVSADMYSYSASTSTDQMNTIQYYDEKRSTSRSEYTQGDESNDFNVSSLLRLLKDSNISITININTDSGIKELNLDKSNIVAK